MIPYGRQNIVKDDLRKINKVLKSKWLTQGPNVPKFEKQIAKFVGAKYAVSTNSASTALHISCIALGLRKNDKFWTSPNSFVASANCGIHCGAKVDFVDIDNDTWNISTNLLKKKLKNCKKANLPKIIIPVHFSGQATDQKEIWKLSKKYKFRIIEDASHSLGALHRGEKVGSCKWSDITVFSFHPVKPITTAEGGMILTNDKKVYQRLLKIRNNGITREYSELKNKKNSYWYYEQQTLGFNYRMNEIEATLGVSQLKRLKKFLKKRNQIAKIYNSNLKDLPLKLPTVLKNNYSTFHLYVVRMKSDNIKNYSYNKFFKKIRSRGIGINLHYIPIHKHPFYQNLGLNFKDLRNSEKYSNEAISLPIYHDLTLRDQKKVIRVLKKVLINEG